MTSAVTDMQIIIFKDDAEMQAWFLVIKQVSESREAHALYLQLFIVKYTEHC